MEQGLLDYVRARLPASSDRGRLEEIARGAGVPYHTLLKIANGETDDPRVSTIENLIRYFRVAEERAA